MSKVEEFLSEMRSKLAGYSPELAAQAILGCEIVAPDCRARIVEVEAYAAANDPGSHAWRGKTQRNQVMFGGPGHLYMYFTYGSHWMANIVCRPEGEAAAILIRAAKPLSGIESLLSRRSTSLKNLLSGPGKLCSAMGLNGAHYGINMLDPRSPFHLAPGTIPKRILMSTRIGLAPGKGEHTPWRFIDADALEWASRPHPKLA